MASSKQLIYFIPAYIGPLKYYEKLIPYLNNTYDIGFLFPIMHSIFTNQMIEYCKLKGYRFEIIDHRINRGKIAIPFFHAIKQKCVYIKRCKSFLDKVKPSKLIAMHNIKFYMHHALFREANRRGIDTIVLQWALNPYHSKEMMDMAASLKSDVKDSFVMTLYNKLLDILYFVFGLDLPKSARWFSFQNAKKIGVINEMAKKSFIAQKYNKKNIEIVGHIDVNIVHDVKQKMSLDENFKESLIKKYDLENGILNILVISTPFHTKDIRIISKDGQKTYYYEIFKMIREIFKEDEANILFKLHPGEEDIYDEQFTIKKYSDVSTTPELVVLSDLYIANPVTTVNFLPIALSSNAVFINFTDLVPIENSSRLDYFNKTGEYYGIFNVIKSRDEFKKALLAFKNKKLEKQYHMNEHFTDSIKCIVRLINT